MLYRRGSYPAGALASVRFIWRAEPAASDRYGGLAAMVARFPDTFAYTAVWASGTHAIWIFMHPSAADDVVNELRSLFADDSTVEVTLRSQELLRYELTGPFANKVLHHLLHLSEVSSDASTPGCTVEQRRLWSVLAPLRSTASLPARCILALTIDDPRLSFPPPKPRDVFGPAALAEDAARWHADSESAQALDRVLRTPWPALVAVSPLWNAQLRHQLLAAKLSNAALDARRAKRLLPTSPLPVTAADARVPILLVQRPGVHQRPVGRTRRLPGPALGFAAGWDLIIPAGFGMAFWRSLVSIGCRPIGLLDRDACALEQGELRFPFDYPDVPAAISEYQARGRSVFVLRCLCAACFA